MYESDLAGVLAFGIFGAFLSIVIGIAVYVLTAIAIMKLGEKQNIPNSWLAWIPVAQFYVLGAIIKELKLGTTTIPRMDLILPLGLVAYAVLFWIPLIGWLLGLAYYATFIYSLYTLFKLYVPKDAVLYTILSAIGLFFIFIFIIRDKDQVVQPATEQ